MDSKYFDQLAPPNAPDAWLAVISPGTEDYVHNVAETKTKLNMAEQRRQCINWINLGHNVVAMQDSPSLRVYYKGGLWCCGTDSPAQLTARKNWFLRYRALLERHLRDPLPAIVHFFERRIPDDLFCTMRSTEAGPFPFPKNADWPQCGHCKERMAFIGVLDFRNYHRIGKARVPQGSLVLHGCDQCTIPCSDDESTSLTWITPEQTLELWGREKMASIDVGVPRDTIEFPTPSYSEAPELTNDPEFSKEHGFYLNFSCPLNKVGGHIHWIQNPRVPVDRNGNAMSYIGQFTGTHDVELADGGMVYVFFSDETRETKAILQYY